MKLITIVVLVLISLVLSVCSCKKDKKQPEFQINNKIADSKYVTGKEFSSIYSVEESNLHKKEINKSADGKVHLIYSVQRYDSSTGKTYWDTKTYWTWEKDLPKYMIDSIDMKGTLPNKTVD